jgi:hypothetical protein
MKTKIRIQLEAIPTFPYRVLPPTLNTGGRGFVHAEKARISEGPGWLGFAERMGKKSPRK